MQRIHTTSAILEPQYLAQQIVAKQRELNIPTAPEANCSCL